MARASKNPVTENEVFLTKEQLETLQAQRAAMPLAGMPAIADDGTENLAAELDYSQVAGSRVKVYRVKPDSRKLSFCFECAPSEYSETLLAHKYGGGDYNVRLYAPDDNNQVSLRSNAFISVEKPLDGIVPGAPLAGIASPHDARLDALVAKLDAQASASVTPPAIEPMEQMRQMFSMLSLMREAIQPASVPAQTPASMLKEMMELQKLAKELNGGTTAPSDSEMLMTTAREFIPVLREAIAGPQSYAAPLSDDAHDAQEVPAPAETNFAQLLKTLCRAAHRGLNVEIYADFVIEEIPESEHDAFFKMLEDKSWFEQLALVNPDVRVHEKWFYALHGELMQMTDDALNDNIAQVQAALTKAKKPGKQLPDGKSIPEKSNVGKPDNS